jgi:hypothetical protein
MKQTRMVVALLLVAVAVPAWAKTYKYTYSNPCSEVWPAVKATLSDAENYAQVKPEDEKIVSNYSGWGHEDQGDFKKRVDESMVKLKAAPPAEPTKPADESKPAKPAEPGK